MLYCKQSTMDLLIASNNLKKLKSNNWNQKSLAFNQLNTLSKWSPTHLSTIYQLFHKSSPIPIYTQKLKNNKELKSNFEEDQKRNQHICCQQMVDIGTGKFHSIQILNWQQYIPSNTDLYFFEDEKGEKKIICTEWKIQNCRIEA